MTPEERFERIEAKHEALVQLVGEIAVAVDGLTVKVDALTVKLDALTSNVTRLVGTVESLADIAKRHEERLNRGGL